VKERFSGTADRSSEQSEVAVLGASPATLTLSRRSINHTARVKMMKSESQRIFQCSYCPCSYMDRTGLYRRTIRLYIQKNARTIQNLSFLCKNWLFLIDMKTITTNVDHMKETSLMLRSNLQWIPFRSPISATPLTIS
jgi:hypothetical protein